MLVEKHKTLNSTRGVIFCSQADKCSYEEIQVGLADQYVLKVYCVHKKQEGKLVPTQTLFLTFES
jgi:hypothetical protein